MRDWLPGFFALSSFIFFPTRSHLVQPTFAFFPIKAKGCDSEIFLAVPDILSLLRNDLSITEPCLDACMSLDVACETSILLAYRILLLCPLMHSSKAPVWAFELSLPCRWASFTLSPVTSTFLSFTSFICCVTGCVSSLRMKVLKQHEFSTSATTWLPFGKVLLHQTASLENKETDRRWWVFKESMAPSTVLWYDFCNHML